MREKIESIIEKSFKEELGSDEWLKCRNELINLGEEATDNKTDSEFYSILEELFMKKIQEDNSEVTKQIPEQKKQEIVSMLIGTIKYDVLMSKATKKIKR